MKSRSRIPEEEKLALLPPCTICSAKSSGLHFGVNTCEACKAFFRRCLNRRKETPLSCIGTGNCIVDISAKTLCSACRYNKCLKYGMSKTAIKTGRYSLERKADLIRDAIAKKGPSESLLENGTICPVVPPCDIAEATMETSSVDSTAAVQYTITDISIPNTNGTVGDASILHDPPQLHSLQAYKSMAESTVSLPSHLRPLNKHPNPQVSSPALAAMLTRSSKSSQDTLSTRTSGIPEQSHPAPDTAMIGYLPLTPASSPSEYSILSSRHISPTGPQSMCASSFRASPSATSTDASVSTTHDLDNMIHLIAAAYERYCPYTKEIKAKIVENQAQYKEEQEFFMDLFGPMKPLAVEEYMEIYTNTGIDVDGRREFATKFFGHVDHMIQRLIGFVKSVPGFTDINIDDQIELIRGGSIDWFVITSASGVNVENQIVTSFFGITFSKDEFSKLGHGLENGIPDSFFALSKLVQELNIDDTGLALMAAVCIIDPEQLAFHISNKEEVASVQYSLMEALHLHLSRTCERPLTVFTRIMLVLTKMRKERAQIHHDRVQAHGFCSKLGVVATPLMNAIVTEHEPDISKRSLVDAVMNDDEKSRVAACEETETSHIPAGKTRLELVTKTSVQDVL